MMPKPLILKLSAVFGSYLLAAGLALAAIPQFKVQDEETLSGAVQSIQEAFSNNEGSATVVLPAKEKRHPWSGFFALSSVLFACAGTGSLIWTLFGKKAPAVQPVAFEPHGILPPSTEVEATVAPPRDRWPTRVPTETASLRPRELQTASFAERQQQLFDRLAHSPESWVLQLLEATPIIIGGEPRSGKSELAQFIALLRVLFVKHDVEVNDPHSHTNTWPKCFLVYGSNFNYTAIDRRLKAYQDRLNQIPQYPLTAIWEDSLQYSAHCPSYRTDSFNLIRSAATEAFGREEFAILVTQERPQQVSEEVRHLLEHYFIQIHLFAQRSPTGRPVPAGRGLLRGLSKDQQGLPEQVEIQLPEWMQAHYLLEMFPELQQIPSMPGTDLLRDRAGSLDSRPERTETFPRDSLGPKDSAHLTRRVRPDPPFRTTTTSKPPSQRLQTIKQFIQLKQQGLNKEETIFKIWRISKSPSQQWEDASIMHDRMFQEYRDFIEARRSLDELDSLV